MYTNEMQQQVGVATVRKESKTNNTHKHYEVTGQTEDRQERVSTLHTTEGTLAGTITSCTVYDTCTNLTLVYISILLFRAHVHTST